MGTCYFSFFLFFFKRGRRLLVSSWLFRQAPSSIGTTTLFMLGSFSGRITSSWAVVSGSAHDYTSQRTPKRRSSCLFCFSFALLICVPVVVGQNRTHKATNAWKGEGGWGPRHAGSDDDQAGCWRGRSGGRGQFAGTHTLTVSLALLAVAVFYLFIFSLWGRVITPFPLSHTYIQ